MPPYLKARESITWIYWKWIAALLPVWVVSLLFFGSAALGLSLASSVGAVIGEVAGRKLMRRKITLGDGSAILMGLLTAMLFPATLPLPYAVLAGFSGVFLARELFGGLGQTIFHPALIGVLFLRGITSFPLERFPAPFDPVPVMRPLEWLQQGNQESLWRGWELFLGYHAGGLGETCIPVILIGGIFLIFQKLIAWEIPVIFLGTLGLVSWALDLDPGISLLSGNAFLAAFFLIPYGAAGPHTRLGFRFFSAGCALLTVGIRFWTVHADGVILAVLIMSACAPWIDDAIRRRDATLRTAGQALTSREQG